MEQNKILFIIGIMTMFSCHSIHKTMEFGNGQLSNSEIIQLLTDDSVKYWIGVNFGSSFKFAREGLRFNSYNKKGDEEFTSQQDILFPKVFDVDGMRVFHFPQCPYCNLSYRDGFFSRQLTYPQPSRRTKRNTIIQP